MPQWLQTVLIILAVLIAIYLVAVLVQIILAKILRRQAELLRASIERARQEVAAARKQLDDLSPAINGGTREMPFRPLYDQARELLRRGLASANEVQKQLTNVTAQEIAEQPLLASFKLAPMSREVAQRMRKRRGVKTVSVYLTEVKNMLGRISQIQSDIETLPGREKDAVQQLQKRSAESSALIEAEARPKWPLAEERSASMQANALIEQASQLLADAKPPQSAVIIAYSLRLKGDEQLLALDNMIAAAKEKRTSVEAAVAKMREQLTALKGAITEDKSAGFARPQFSAQANDLDTRATATQTMVEQGDYDGGAGAIAELNKDIAAQQLAFNTLKQECARVSGLVNKVSQYLATVTQWINEAPHTFDLDITRAASQQLQDAADRLRALLPSEDIAAMGAADELDAQAEDIFKCANNVHKDFLAAERRYDELSKTLNNSSVQALASQSVQVASELGKANQNYWGNLTPEAITASADELSKQWQPISSRLSKIKESELTDVLNQLSAVQTDFNRASEMHAEGVKALTQLDADQLQANTALNDDVMNRLLADMETIRADSPSVAEQPELIQARVEELRGELKTTAPDFKTINANAQRLRREAEEFVADYQRQLQHVRAQLGLLKYRLIEARDDAARLNENVQIDFTPMIGPATDRVSEWLAGFDDVAANPPLDAAYDILVEGETIEREAVARIGEGEAIRKSVSEETAALKMVIAELNGTLSSAQAGLHDMADVGGERWGVILLDPPRQPLTQALERLAKLEQPAHKFTPEAAQAEMSEIEMLVQTAQAHALEAHADIARRVNEVRAKRSELSQALSASEAAAQANPDLTDDWQLVRQQVSGLELRWTNATSYAEALEALTQATQRAQRFAEGARE